MANNPLLAVFIYVNRHGVKRSGGLSSLQLACNQAEWGVLCGAAAGGLGSLGLGSLVVAFDWVGFKLEMFVISMITMACLFYGSFYYNC